MSKFQQMKRQQAAAHAAANNKLPAGIKSSKATVDDDTTTTNITTPTTVVTTTSSTTTTDTTDLARLTSLYPLPAANNKADARRRWNLDSTSSSSSSSTSLLPSAASSSLLSHRDISFPSGYLTGDYDTQPTPSTSNLAKTADLVYQSAMNTALAPGKQLLMTAFMLWMSGNTLQIFSIMMLGMALYQPLQKIMNVGGEFARYSGNGGVNLLLPQLVFVACNVAGVGLALWKCQQMGLLPTSSADWLSTQVRPAVEFSGGGASYL